MNVKNRTVELRTSKFTTDSGALQKGEDFVKAFTLGFDTRSSASDSKDLKFTSSNNNLRGCYRSASS